MNTSTGAAYRYSVTHGGDSQVKKKASMNRTDKGHDMKVTKLVELGSIAVYLTTFEQLMKPLEIWRRIRSINWPHSWWESQAISLLAYTVIRLEETGEY